ncbi:DUF6350 family protein [Janibacter alittae]|uniref:DUF6350 family protein n=1 Tax=Janibacter alittae TaxID=3115209 RepID=A0ABZ2MF42_9MICO
MTVLELIRSAATADDVRRRPELRAAGAGVLTALAGLLAPLALVLLAALAVPRAAAGVGESIGSGALLWLVLGGARLSLDGGTVALTPLVWTLALLVLARYGARRGLPEEPDLRLQGSWLGGYAAVGVIAALLGLLAPIGPDVLSLVLPLLVLPVVALAWAHGLPEGIRALWRRAPVALHRGLVPGAKGALATVAAGSALVLVAVGVNIARVMQVHADLGAGFFGGLLLVLLQVGLLPNLGVWGASFAAGPGFTTGGATTTWAAADSGLLPMVPALAAQPQPGDLHWATHLLILLPLLIGVWLGRETLVWVPRLAATQTKLAVIAVSVGVAALGVVGLDLLGGGSLGAEHLAHLGAPAQWLGLVLVLELGLGALAVFAREWWVLRR